MTDSFHAEYRFGDDTTTLDVPGHLTARLAPDNAQPDSQDTASFLVEGADGSVVVEITASHFSSGNRAANMDKYRAIVKDKLRDAAHPQVVMGDINTEVKTAEDLQQLADDIGLVVVIPSLKIRRLRGLQDQLHKRMDRKDDYDSMFVAVDAGMVDAEALAALEHQNVAWPGEADRLTWNEPQVAQAWMDDRILTDHAVVKVPLVGGDVVTLGNAARANYDKYSIQNQAKISRRTYLEGQQVMETEVANAVIAFVADLPASEGKATALAGLVNYREALGGYYKAALNAWDDADDLTGPDTPLGAAIETLGKHAQSFVKAVRALSWEDVRDAPEARETFGKALTDALVSGLGIDGGKGPLSGHEAFSEDDFRAKSHAKIEAAWARIIKRQAAGDLYKMWFAELLHGQTTGGMPIPTAVLAQPTDSYIAKRRSELGLDGTICVIVEALR